MNILHATNKVGLLPYRFAPLSCQRTLASSVADEMDASVRWHDREVEFLLHLPRPKNPAEAHLMKWGVARGTVRWRAATGEWQDIRDALQLSSIAPELIEPHDQAALHEAEEELGLVPADMDMATWRDHGLHDYVSETRGHYPIHLFSVQVRQEVACEALKAHAKDALDVAWFTLPQIRELVTQGCCKQGYVSMVEAVTRSFAGKSIA